MLFAGILLLGYQYFKEPSSLKISQKHWPALFMLGFLNIYLTNISEIWGLQHMHSSKACLIYSLSPFLSALIAYPVLKETLTFKKGIGLLIGVTGVLPIFLQPNAAEPSFTVDAFLSYPEMALLTAVVCSVYGWILLKKIVSHYKHSPIVANGISMILGGSMALWHSYLSGETWQPFPVTEWWPFLHNTLLLCVISNLICYNLYGYLLKRYSATFMSFAGLVTPLFASLFGWLFLQEQISIYFFGSFILFAIGLLLFYQEELKRDKIYVN